MEARTRTRPFSCPLRPGRRGARLCGGFARAGAGQRPHVAGAELGAAAVAREASGQRAAAVAVLEDARRAGVLGVVLVAPADEPDEHGPEAPPLLRQPVLEALRALLVGHALEDALVDEAPQPGGQHVAGDPQRALEILEAPHAEERVAQHEQRPALADHLERARDRAGLVLVEPSEHLVTQA